MKQKLSCIKYFQQFIHLEYINLLSNWCGAHQNNIHSDMLPLPILSFAFCQVNMDCRVGSRHLCLGLSFNGTNCTIQHFIINTINKKQTEPPSRSNFSIARQLFCPHLGCKGLGQIISSIAIRSISCVQTRLQDVLSNI